MKNLLLLLSLFYFEASAQGFGPASTNWSTPTGGYFTNSGNNIGYFHFFNSGASDENSQNWTVSDINGDAKPDLIVTSEYHSSTNGLKQFGAGTTPYWKVYLNTGSDISTNATTWSTPTGGFFSSTGVNIGYYHISFVGASYNNSENWNLLDMNGDNKPDLVVTAEYQSSAGGVLQFGAGSSPYWKVYLNNGSGFSTTATNWTTPIGGYYQNAGVNIGYYDVSFQGASYNNSQNWSLADMNGDAMPDLLVFAEYQSATNGVLQYGAGSSPFWKVYLNTGSGFASTATNWSTPVGGYFNSTGTNIGYFTAFFSGASYNNSQNWSLKDMDGDSKPDLVVPSEYKTVNNGVQQFGVGSSPYWKVYLNNGNGFLTSVATWTTPVGGFYSSTGVNTGYYELSAYGYPNINSQNWIVQDLDGDARPELIVSADCQNVNTGQMQFGAGTAPYWKVYRNTGAGYANTNVVWTTPIGGYYTMSGANLGYFLTTYYGSSFDDSENWTLADMNGDGMTDLVIPSEYQSAFNGQLQYGVGTSPYWIVYINNGFVGLAEQSVYNSLSVYPNPFAETIFIDTKLSGDLFIYTITGEVVYQQTWTPTSSSIDLSTLPQGVYVMKLIGEREIETARIVK
ncbi:MAG: T9SS type A sorting domain-containing protein [Bacteroidia bacterium]